MQLPRLTEVTDYESFGAFVKKERKADPHLAEMLKFIPDLKWSLDESMTTIGYVYHQISELHVLYSYSNGKRRKQVQRAYGHWAAAKIGSCSS